MPEKTTQKEHGKKTAPPSEKEVQPEVVIQIPLAELHPFPDHPFQVRDDDSMRETAESVKAYGVLVPAIVRPREEGGYEIIAGHRRKHACELAELATMPAIVRNMDRDTATIIMVDSNLQRENILPSERNHTHDISRTRGIWSPSTVLRILEDERYIGSYVIGKRAVLEVGGTRSRMKDRDKWYIIPDHHPAIVEKATFEKVQASQLRFSQPNKKKRDYPLKGKAFCGCCGHALSRTMQKTSYYYCRHSEADEESRCHKMRVNAVELEKAVFIMLKKQMEAAASLNPDGTVRLDAAAPERSEYEQQIEELQDGKRLLYERYLLGEIDLDTYKAEKAACDELLLKTKNAYAVVLAQAKQKQEEQARNDNRQEAARAVFNSEGLTAELTDLLIDKVLVYPDNRIEIAYKIKDIFD